MTLLIILLVSVTGCGTTDKAKEGDNQSKDESPTELVISTWGYSEDLLWENVFTPFEEANNVKIVLETGNNSERLTKLKTNPDSNIDIIYLAEAFAQEGIGADLFDKIDLMVMGKNPKDMTVAVNWIIENGGGYCVLKDGIVLAGVELSVGGIISEERIDILAGKVKSVSEKMEMLGYEHDNRIMSFSTLSLPVSPSLKISDRELIDVVKQEVVDLFYDNESI